MVKGKYVNRYPGAIGLPHVCSDILSDLDMTGGGLFTVMRSKN